MAKPYLELKNCGALLTADHKVLSDNCDSRNNHRYAVVVQDLATQWIQSYPCKQKLHRKHREACKSSWNPRGNQKSFILTIPRNSAKPCEDLSWNHCTSTPHRSETNGIAQRAVRRVKESSAVLLQSGLEEIWWADYLRNVTDLLSDGKTPYERRFGEPFKGPINPFGSLVESITLFLRKASQESINLERKFYLDCSSDTHCTRGDCGRVTYWLQTLRSWKRWTHQKSTQKTQCKGSDISQGNGKTFSPVAEGRIKLLGGDQDLRTSTLIRHRPIRGESHVDFLGEAEGSLSPPHDSFPDAGEAMNDFWSMSGNFIYRHHVEPRVKLYSPRTYPELQERIWMLNKSAASTIIWNADGSRDLSESWTGFTQFFSFRRGTSRRIYVVRAERLTRKQLTSRPDHVCPELWTKLRRNAQLKERQRWLKDNARKLRGIYFIDHEDKEFKETIKNACKKLETPMAPAMPCKTSRNSQHSNKIKSKHACFLGSQ